MIDVNKEANNIAKKLSDFAEKTPLKLDSIKICHRELSNYSFIYAPNATWLDKVFCKCFGHIKYSEQRFYEDVSKDSFIKKYRCPRCGHERRNI